MPDVCKEMEIVKNDSNIDHEEFKCVNGVQTLKMDNLKVTNASSKYKKSPQDMLRMATPREEVLQKCKTQPIRRRDQKRKGILYPNEWFLCQIKASVL